MATAAPVLASIEAWRSSLPDSTPTANMMRWMSKFQTPCTKACCFSPMCGCIRCTNCRTSLTSLDTPKVRYQCMECPIILSGPSSRPELCDICFRSDSVALHDHALFCKVDELGRHTMVRRTRTVTRKQLLESDFLVAESSKEEICPVCCEEFSADKRPVCPPGCKRGHGESKSDPVLGIVDTGVHYCAECALGFQQSRDRGTYCDITTYCQCCQHEDEMSGWREEFRELFAKGSEPRNTRRDMYALHVQPWIRSVLDEEYRDRMKQLRRSLAEEDLFPLRGVISAEQKTDCDDGKACTIPSKTVIKT